MIFPPRPIVPALAVVTLFSPKTTASAAVNVMLPPLPSEPLEFNVPNWPTRPVPDSTATVNPSIPSTALEKVSPAAMTI